MLKDFAKFQTFLMVVKEKSFSNASAKLGISQPAVTQQIKFIEEYLDTKIVERKKNGILLTKEGEDLYRIALKLEKAILERYPIDFHDVWAVAMDRIKKLALTRPKSVVVNLDLDWLVSEIKQEYPNLFYHLDQILASKH